MLFLLALFCFSEEDNHRCPVVLGAEAGLSRGPPESNHKVFLRQAVCDWAGGAQTVWWVVLSSLISVNKSWCVDSRRSPSALPPSSHRLFLPVQQWPHTQPVLVPQARWGANKIHIQSWVLTFEHLIFLLLFSFYSQVCPKWAKVQKQHTVKSSVVLLIVCSSALRTIDLIK